MGIMNMYIEKRLDEKKTEAILRAWLVPEVTRLVLVTPYGAQIVRRPLSQLPPPKKARLRNA